MRRREFITLIGGAAAAWPLAVRAQQSAVPVVGFLNSASPEPYTDVVAAFRRGLGQTGYLEGRNVAIEYRWAEGRSERYSELAAELVRLKVKRWTSSRSSPHIHARWRRLQAHPIHRVGNDLRYGEVALKFLPRSCPPRVFPELREAGLAASRAKAAGFALVDGKQLAAVLRIKSLWCRHCSASQISAAEAETARHTRTSVRSPTQSPTVWTARTARRWLPPLAAMSARLALIPRRNVIGGATIRQNVMQITVRKMGSAYACEG
jgi:hypothetical protein